MITHITNLKKYPKYQQKLVIDSDKIARKFIEDKYNVSEHYVMIVRLSSTCRFSYYAPDTNNIRIKLNSVKWYTYKRKTIGLYADDIYVGLGTNLILNMIHEYTHFIQGMQKRKFSEVETTLNEIEYVKNNHPEIYKKLKKI